jgi:hypothetical protein
MWPASGQSSWRLDTPDQPWTSRPGRRHCYRRRSHAAEDRSPTPGGAPFVDRFGARFAHRLAAEPAIQEVAEFAALREGHAVEAYCHQCLTT